MPEVKWIKITTDIFDDEKILLIESLPESDSIIVIWFKLLCLAGKMNNSGVFVLNDKIPYTIPMLATIFRRKETTVRLALETFAQFGMVEIVDDVITIPNWGKHQNLDQLENKKNYMRNYMKEYRAKQKELACGNTYNPAGLPLNEWSDVLKEFDYSCAYCGSKENLEQDHVVPFSDGGTTTKENVVPACRRCNSSKGPKIITEWYPGQDFFDRKKMERIQNHAGKLLRKYLRKSNVSRADKDIDIDIDLYINNKSKKEIKTKEDISLLGGAEKPSVFALPLNTGESFHIYQDDIDKWSELYPSVDVMQQIRNMYGWLDSNPSKRKTKNGIRRFIANWLSKEQDRGGQRNGFVKNGQTTSRKTFDPVTTMSEDEIERIFREG